MKTGHKTDEWVEFARIGYQAYGEAAGWKAYNDQPMPQWEALPDHIKQRWIAATKEIIEQLMERCSFIVEALCQGLLQPTFYSKFRGWLQAGAPHVGVDPAKPESEVTP